MPRPAESATRGNAGSSPNLASSGSHARPYEIVLGTRSGRITRQI